MRRINHLALHQLVSRIFGALGLSEDKAALLSDSLVMADLWGQDLNLRPSGYEPDMTLRFLRVTATGLQKVTRKPMTLIESTVNY